MTSTTKESQQKPVILIDSNSFTVIPKTGTPIAMTLLHLNNIKETFADLTKVQPCLPKCGALVCTMTLLGSVPLKDGGSFKAGEDDLFIKQHHKDSCKSTDYRIFPSAADAIRSCSCQGQVLRVDIAVTEKMPGNSKAKCADHKEVGADGDEDDEEEEDDEDDGGDDSENLSDFEDEDEDDDDEDADGAVDQVAKQVKGTKL